MIESRRVFLGRALESLEGARSEYASGRYHNCANRAYYACFQAAIHALLTEGFVPVRGDWGHDFVEAQFVGQLISRRHVYPTALRSVLDQNRRLRLVADYSVESVNQVRASRTIQRASLFVESIVARTEARA